MTDNWLREKARGALLGLACGDAVGTTVEFCQRGRFEPVTDMVGGGKFRLAPGEWTDDTSMALCLAESLIACQGFDARDQMERYWQWADTGHNSARPHPIGMGKTVISALRRYKKTGDPYAGDTDSTSSGNGGLMRLVPAVVAYRYDLSVALSYAQAATAVTHRSEDCLAASGLFAEMLFRALNGECDKSLVLSPPFMANCSSNLSTILNGDYQTKDDSEIRGSGWVVESLEAALWAFWHGKSFGETVLLATNLGDDADTTAAIAGQLAGAFFGERGIPHGWRQKLYRGEDIGQLAELLLETFVSNTKATQ